MTIINSAEEYADIIISRIKQLLATNQDYMNRQNDITQISIIHDASQPEAEERNYIGFDTTLRPRQIANVNLCNCSISDNGTSAFRYSYLPSYNGYLNADFDNEPDLQDELGKSAESLLKVFCYDYDNVVESMQAYSNIKAEFETSIENKTLEQHLMLDIIDNDVLSKLYDDNPFATMPHPDIANFSYILMYVNDANDIYHITKEDLDSTDYVFDSNLLNIAKIKTNSIVVKHLQDEMYMKIVVDDFVEEKIRKTRLPEFLAHAIAQDIFEQITDVDKSVRYLTLKDCDMPASVILASDIGLTMIIKRLNAKHTIQLFPSATNYLLVRNADASIEYPGCVYSISNQYETRLKEQKVAVFTTHYRMYDIHNQMFSLIPTPSINMTTPVLSDNAEEAEE